MVLHYNWPFEGKHTAQEAWDEIDFHTLDLDSRDLDGTEGHHEPAI